MNHHHARRFAAAMMFAGAAAVFSIAAVAQSPTTAPTTAPAATQPADLEHLARLGSRDVRLHDPSSIVRCGDEYWLFHTGRGVPSLRSTDLKTWTQGPRIFPEQGPAWVRDEIPANRNGNDFWAPEVIHLGGRYLVYYSVSSWGKNTSAIALATNATLDPADPKYAWKDEGVVFKSVTGQNNYNAIDPAPFLDVDGKLWMAFGSFWGGVQMVELDPATGKRIAPESTVHTLAWKEQIEGPYLFRRNDHYYMVVAWGWCCRGVNSTYNVRVGRADRVIGPYLDRDGRDMREGGGTLLLGTDGAFIGPGQPSILSQPSEAGRTDGDAERFHLVTHFYDATRRGRSTLAITPLAWDADGWPVTAVPEAKPIGVAPPPAALDLDPFYAKSVDAMGLPIVSSAKVPDDALLAAADLVRRMMRNRPDLCAAMAERKVKLTVMAKDEVTTDVPEHSKLTPKAHWDRRARGLGGTPWIPTTSCAEENVLGYDDDRYCGESILIHEFAHTVHEVGLRAVDKAFDGRLNALFDSAMAKGLWKNTYATTNRNEYWAEGVQCYFDCNAVADPPNGIHNHVRTREQLKAYDPELAALVAEIFKDEPWRWTPNGAHRRKWEPGAAAR